jgi:hypothetical protein
MAMEAEKERIMDEFMIMYSKIRDDILSRKNWLSGKLGALSESKR